MQKPSLGNTRGRCRSAWSEQPLLCSCSIPGPEDADSPRAEHYVAIVGDLEGEGFHRNIQGQPNGRESLGLHVSAVT